MSLTNIVCTSCGSLCSDILIEFEENRIRKIENACLKGSAVLYASDVAERRAPFLVEGRRVAPEEAVERAARLLQQARRPLIFGLDNCTLEAQEAGIALAQTLGAVLDDVSSFSHGAIVEWILRGEIPTCDFPDAQKADLYIYWGCNPYHSHPRHFSRDTYYPREKFDEAGWRPTGLVVSCVEVRDTETTLMCDPVFKLKPGGDREFIESIFRAMEDREKGNEQSLSFLELINNSKCCVIFVGLGLIYALDNDLTLFQELVDHLNRWWTRCLVIPMLGHFNTLGFNRSLFDKTGYVNRVSFADGVSHGEEFSFLRQVKDRAPDCVLIVGSDPFSSQPASLMRNLEGLPLICMDPFLTRTARAAQVVLGTALSGLEQGGRAIRMDGTMVSLPQGRQTGIPGDEEILRQLLERITK
jgi:formylmethanofuran dehydrogenase subunit B